MAKKKQKHPHIDKSPVRKRKAKQWIQNYAGTDVVKDYREHFKGVDVACAVRELQEIGYAFERDYVENVLKAEAVRISQAHKKKEAKQEADNDNDWQDDRFYYIAGYTSGGAPYGITWEEMGLEPWEDEFDDEDIVHYRDYDSLGKRETEYVNNRLRDGFSGFVKEHGELPGKAEQEELIQKVFSTCAGGPLYYYKSFLGIYRKIIKKRYNKCIREGVSPDQGVLDSKKSALINNIQEIQK
jgi:hypothetical protein